MTRSLWRSLLAAAFLFVLTGSASAQGMGSIFGKVTDASGAVMPGVTVTVMGTGLQLPRTAVTTETGAYQFPNIPIGTYVVTFELQGFKKATRADILIVAGFNAPVDQSLAVGQMTEELTVSGMTPVVDTKRTTVGGTFDVQTLETIPTARDPWMIIYMAPGVQLSGTNVGGSGSGGQPRTNDSSGMMPWRRRRAANSSVSAADALPPLFMRASASSVPDSAPENSIVNPARAIFVQVASLYCISVSARPSAHQRRPRSAMRSQNSAVRASLMKKSMSCIWTASMP